MSQRLWMAHTPSLHGHRLQTRRAPRLRCVARSRPSLCHRNCFVHFILFCFVFKVYFEGIFMPQAALASNTALAQLKAQQLKECILSCDQVSLISSEVDANLLNTR